MSVGQREVTSGVESLGISLDVLADLTSELANRLGPVLSREDSEVACAGEEKAPCPTSPLAQRLLELDCKVRNEIGHLSALLRRLEI